MIRSFIKILFLALPALCSCTEDDGPDTPGTPPAQITDTESGLTVSFTGKHFRLADGISYGGQITQQWTDTVWQNDRAYNQIVLTASAGDIANLSVSASALEGRDSEIPAANVRLRTVQPVAGDAAPAVDAQPMPRPTAYVYDALTDGTPSKIAAGQNTAIWVTVDIPADCTPGTYSGEISIKSGDNTLAVCKLNMLVTGWRLPDPAQWDFHLDIWQFPFQLPSILADNGSKVEMFTEQYFELMRPFYSLLADAGQKTVTAYIKDGAFNRGQTMVEWSRRADGAWQFDYTDFDRYVEFMASLGIDRQISCFSLAGWNNSVGYKDLADGRYKYLDLPVESQEFASVWSVFLSDFRSHLLQKGWFDRTVLFMDENNNDEMRLITKVIRDNGSDWKIGLSGRYIDADVEREFYNYSTIIGTAPSTTAVSVPLFYTSCSQTRPNNYLTPVTSPAEMTWMAWHALAKGFKGYQRWAFDYWTRPDIFDARDRANTAGDFHMIYRSGNGPDARPVSSIRWEMLRDGIQDYEKARLLGAHKLRGVTARFADDSAPDAPEAVIAAQAEIKKLSAR